GRWPARYRSPPETPDGSRRTNRRAPAPRDGECRRRAALASARRRRGPPSGGSPACGDLLSAQHRVVLELLLAIDFRTLGQVGDVETSGLTEECDGVEIGRAH